MWWLKKDNDHAASSDIRRNVNPKLVRCFGILNGCIIAFKCKIISRKNLNLRGDVYK
jgi:hypothetical protein